MPVTWVCLGTGPQYEPRQTDTGPWSLPPAGDGPAEPSGDMQAPSPGRAAERRNANRMFFLRKYFVSSAGHSGGKNLDVFVALRFCFEPRGVPPRSRLFPSLSSVDVWGHTALRGGGCAVCGAPSSHPSRPPPAGTLASLPTPSYDNQELLSVPGRARHPLGWGPRSHNLCIRSSGPRSYSRKEEGKKLFKKCSVLKIH